MALEDVKIDLYDDTLTVISTPRTVEFGNTVSLVVGKVGAGVGNRVGYGDGFGDGARGGVGARVGGGIRAGAGDGSTISK
jgi:hypothetical protein